MRYPGDVRVDGDGHDAGVLGALGIQTLELIHGAVQELGRLVMLDHHHRDVVELDRVRDRVQRAGSGPQFTGLVVQYPIRHVFDPFLGQNVGRLEGLGKSRAEPSARPSAGKPFDRRDGLSDGGSLVLEKSHGRLNEAVRHELPAGIAGGAGETWAVLAYRGIDRERRLDIEAIQRRLQAPETNPHAVLVPGPVGQVRHHGITARRRQDRARHRLLDLPVLDVDDRPHHHPRAVRQLQGSTVHDGAVLDPLARLHGSLPSLSVLR